MLKGLKSVVGSSVVFGVLVIALFQYVNSQAATLAKMERQVQIHIPNKLQPVVVTKVTLGDTVVQHGRFIKPANERQDPVEPFTADDDWVQNLTVYFLNRSDRMVVQTTLHFSFPDATDRATNSRPLFSLSLGRIPPSVSYDRGRALPQNSLAEPLVFRPGQTMAVHLGDYIDSIKAAIEPSMPLAAHTSMNVNIDVLYFEDGLRWIGSFQTLDPVTHVWRRVTIPNFFPGDPDTYWPGMPRWVEPK